MGFNLPSALYLHEIFFFYKTIEHKKIKSHTNLLLKEEQSNILIRQWKNAKQTSLERIETILYYFKRK